MTTSHKTLDELLLEIDRDARASVVPRMETFINAIAKAKSVFVSAVATENMTELKSLAYQLSDSTDILHHSFANNPAIYPWLRPLSTLADVAQKLYETMNPKVEAEKLLETNEGGRIMRALYDRNYTFAELQMWLGIDYFGLTDAMRILTSGGLITSETPPESESGHAVYRLKGVGKDKAEKMFPELKLSGCGY